jgi:hypothetical protein
VELDEHIQRDYKEEQFEVEDEVDEFFIVGFHSDFKIFHFLFQFLVLWHCDLD